MTLDEAIKKLKPLLQLKPDHDPFPDGLKDAFWLGIEALEAYQELRGRTAIDVEDVGRLPSETKRKDPAAGFTKEELADLRNAACDDTIG